MNQQKTVQTIRTMRYISRTALLILGSLLFVFALFSGSADYGGGVMGVVKNSPNSIPWALMLLLVWLSWKKELIGGIIFVILGIASSIFFNFWQAGSRWGLIAISLPLVLFGSLFITSWKLTKVTTNDNKSKSSK